MAASSRYIRQTSLAGFGEIGQAQLSAARILIVGLGGLGVPVAQYLNAMGVGTLGLVENDTVALHNLQRQVLYTENDVGKPKLEVALHRLHSQNTTTVLQPFATYLQADNALSIIKDFDLVVDATDNFGTRYLINDACVMLKKPFVYGALQGMEGQVSVFNYNNGPTYRCLFPNPPNSNEIPNCNENGILGVLPGIVGTLQALEAIKLAAGMGEVLSGELLLYDGFTQTTRKIQLTVNPVNQNITQLATSYEIPQCSPVPQIDSISFAAKRQDTKMEVIDVRNPEEYASFHLPEAKSIPLAQLEDQLDQINDNQTTYFICQTGIRSRKAVEIVKTAYPDAALYSVEGGMTALEALSNSSL